MAACLRQSLRPEPPPRAEELSLPEDLITRLVIVSVAMWNQGLVLPCGLERRGVRGRGSRLRGWLCCRSSWRWGAWRAGSSPRVSRLVPPECAVTTAWEAGVAVSLWFHVEEERRGSLLVPRAGAAGSLLLLLPSSGHLPCCRLLQQCPGEQGHGQPGQGEGQPGAGIACGR